MHLYNFLKTFGWLDTKQNAFAIQSEHHNFHRVPELAYITMSSFRTTLQDEIVDFVFLTTWGVLTFSKLDLPIKQKLY